MKVNQQKNEKKCFGVLFVHGIGLQKRGDIIVEWGEKIVAWLRSWLALKIYGPIDVEVLDTKLEKAPSHSRISFRKNTKLSHHSWLLAESWWAESYNPPGFKDVLRWAFVTVPRTIIIHFVPRMRSGLDDIKLSQKSTRTDQEFLIMTGGSLRIIGCIFAFPLLGIVGIAVEALIILLSFISLIPNKMLRKFIGSIQTIIAGVIGDSFIFLDSPLRKSATISQVQRDLEWISSRCDEVVVVAHSQGAAVAHKALQILKWGKNLPKQFAGLVTFGSGLRKLNDLENTKNHSGLWTLMSGATILFSGLLSFSLIMMILGKLALWITLPGTLVSFIVLSIILFSAGILCQDSPPHVGKPWIDFYASHDLVPNGQLLTRTEVPGEKSSAKKSEAAAGLERAIEGLEYLAALSYRTRSEEVINLQSYLRDHVTYWSNTDDFVSRLMLFLGQVSDFRFDLSLDRAWVQIAVVRRRWRVNLLKWFRRFVLTVPAAIIVKHSLVMKEIGSAIISRLETITNPPIISTDTLKVLIKPISPYPTLVGLIISFAFIYFIYKIGTAAWRYWQKKELSKFFDRDFNNEKVIRNLYRLEGIVIFLFIWLIVMLGSSWLWLSHSGQLLKIMFFPCIGTLAVGVSFILVIFLSLSRAPGNKRDFGLISIAEAERNLLAKNEQSREVAEYCFSIARKLLGEQDDTADIFATANGFEEALKRLNNPDRAAILDKSIKRLPELLKVLNKYKIDSSYYNTLLRKKENELKTLQ
jgi:hypothetical protein